MRSYILTINKALGRFYDSLLSFRYILQYKRLLRRNKLPITCEDHYYEQYRKKWSILKKPKKVYYELFSRYCGNNIDIVPEDICHNIIEAVLNPPKYRALYEDKNYFDFFVGSENMPKTLLRCINGIFYDACYNFIGKKDIEVTKYINSPNIVIKGTIETSSGIDVLFYEKSGNTYLEANGGGKILELSYIAERLKNNFIIQERGRQSEFFSTFCVSSINTIRLLTYRSVKDDKVHILNGALRMGQLGKLKDNAHQGGKIVSIDINSGRLGNVVFDQYGNDYKYHNGIDFSVNHFCIPYWDRVLEFAKQIGESIKYHRLLNLDIMVDENNQPKLIEYNISSMSVWIFQFCGSPAFSDFTDEIIEYCKENIHNIRSQYLYI